MAHITYSLSTGILSWSAFGTWDAVSGLYGSGALPIGLYQLERRNISEYTNNIGKPFKDKTGKGFLYL